MSFDWHGYKWEGAFTDPNKLEDRSGIYAVWCKTGESWKILDIGESHEVQTRVLNHDRAPQWAANCRGTLYYAAHYTPSLQQPGRREIEKRLRQLANPPCGDR